MKETVIQENLENERGPALDEAVVVVVGYGRSGRAAADLLDQAGARVRVTDVSTPESLGIDSPDEYGGTYDLAEAIRRLGKSRDKLRAELAS